MPEFGAPLSLFDGLLRYENAKFYYLGYPLPLTGSEKQILLCLMKKHPEAVTARDTPLLGLALSGDPRGLLRAHISHINRKAFAIGERSLITCQKNVGYKIANSL